MLFNKTTMATVLLVTLGAVAAAPVLYQGFRRRGKGVRYERNFLVQRAPQLLSLGNLALIVLSFLAFNNLIDAGGLMPLLTVAQFLAEPARSAVSWAGVAVLSSGLVFMIGGWYSLGDCFSTDAELLEKQTIRESGLLKLVMHPAYSGIIQSLLGASLATLSLSSALVLLALVAPSWLKRARYEEKLLIEAFGKSYTDYADKLKWRRLVPSFIPIGI